MPNTALSTEFPDVYARILPGFFEQPFPQEMFATCNNCAMTCNPSAGASKMFSPDKKCCTYYPALPNFLVGAVLSQDAASEESRKRVAALIEKRQGVSPVGVFPPRIFHALYQRGHEAGFGNSAALLCPYFESSSGKCTIWRYREAVCSTYFCKTVGGKSGNEFWEAVKSYLQQVQRALTIYVLRKMRVPNASDLMDEYMSQRYANGKLTVGDLDGRVTDDEWRKTWGEWSGREHEFFMACHREVKGMERTDFERISGIESDFRLSCVREKYSAMATIPATLKRSQVPVGKSNGQEEYLVRFGHAEIVVRVPVVVLDMFDGNTSTDVIIEQLKSAHAIELDLDLVMALWHNKTLVSASS